MIIKRKKIGNVITLVIASFGLLMFFIVSIAGLLSDRTIMEKVAFLLFLGASTLGLYSTLVPMRKVLSDSPEFEIAEHNFLIYDNPSFDRIPYIEMLECCLYHRLRSTSLGISLKDNSNIRSNASNYLKFMLNVPKDKSNIVLLNLDFADIEHRELVTIIAKKISEANTRA